MISKFTRLKSLAAVLLAVWFAATLTGCQKVSISRVSSKAGNVDQTCRDFVTHYLDTDAKTYASSQAELKQDASPGLIQTMKKAGVLAKNEKELKAKIAQLAKRKVKDTIAIDKVEIGDVAANGLIPATVSGVLTKGERPESFAYKLSLGIRKDNGKLAIVTITKQ
jgi:hypothetical protein